MPPKLWMAAYTSFVNSTIPFGMNLVPPYVLRPAGRRLFLNVPVSCSIFGLLRLLMAALRLDSPLYVFGPLVLPSMVTGDKGGHLLSGALSCLKWSCTSLKPRMANLVNTT